MIPSSCKIIIGKRRDHAIEIWKAFNKVKGTWYQIMYAAFIRIWMLSGKSQGISQVLMDDVYLLF